MRASVLPTELLVHIFSHTLLRDLPQIASTCRRFHEIIDHHEDIVVAQLRKSLSASTLGAVLIRVAQNRTCLRPTRSNCNENATQGEIGEATSSHESEYIYHHDEPGHRNITSSSRNTGVATPHHVHLIRKLVRAGADVNHSDAALRGCTPIISACENGYLCGVKELIANGAQVDITNDDGVTVLMSACEHGYDEIVRVLLSANADLQVKCKHGTQALHYAVSNGHTTVTQQILRAGADVNVIIHKRELSPLHIACRSGYTDIAELLLTAGANVDAKTSYHSTALYISSHRGDTDLVKQLITYNANVNAAMLDGMTPLHAACMNQHTKVVEALIEAGADVNVRTKDSGKTALMAAASGSDVVIVDLLITAGANQL